MTSNVIFQIYFSDFSVLETVFEGQIPFEMVDDSSDGILRPNAVCD